MPNMIELRKKKLEEENTQGSSSGGGSTVSSSSSSSGSGGGSSSNSGGSGAYTGATVSTPSSGRMTRHVGMPTSSGNSGSTTTTRGKKTESRGVTQTPGQTVSSPIDQSKVDQLDLNTTRGTLAKIDSIWQTDQELADEIFSKYLPMTQDPTSPYYRPFDYTTNRAVAALEELGIDTTGIGTQEWLDENAYLKQYYKYSTYTNNPSAPTKRSSKEEKQAYWYYQIALQQEDTDNALAELDSVRNEISYWVGRTDLNLSDDQILQRLNIAGNSKYKTLNKMDETRGQGNPMELNTVLGYNGEEDLRTMIWQARNGGGSGNYMRDMINSVFGNGNVWKQNDEIAARLNSGNLSTYAPYTVGMTGLDEEGAYFGRSSFDQAWIDANWSKYVGTGDPTAEKMMVSVQDAEDYTQIVEGQRDAMYKKIDTWLGVTDDPDKILKWLQEDDDHEFTELFKLDKSKKKGAAGLKATTRNVNYDWNDVVAYVQDKCGAGKKSTVDVVGEATATDSVLSEEELSLEDQVQRILDNVAPTVLGRGTESEKAALQTGKTGRFDWSTDQLANNPRDPGEWMESSATQNLVGGYFGESDFIYTYDEHKANRDQAQKSLDAIIDRWTALNDRQETAGAVGDLTRDQYQNLMSLVNEEDDPVWGDARMVLDSPDTMGKDWALEMLYSRVTGESLGGKSDSEYQEGLQQAQRWWDHAKTGGETLDFLTEEELEEKAELDRLKGYYEGQLSEENAYLEDEANLYQMAKAEQESLKKSYITAALANGGDATLVDSLDMLFEAGRTEVLPQYLTNNVYDMYVADGSMTREQATAQAATSALYNSQLADELETRMLQLDSLGASIPDDMRKNIEDKIAFLRQDSLGSSYLLLDELEGFEDGALIGRESAADGYYKGEIGRLAKAIATGHYGFDWGNPLSYLGAGNAARETKQVSNMQEIIDVMTEEEKNRFFYLLDYDESGEAAKRYWDTLTDEQTGILLNRRSEDVQEQMRAFGQEHPILATGLSFVTNFAGGPSALIYEATQKLSGKTIGVNSPYFDEQLGTSSLRAGVKEDITNYFGEGTFGDIVGNLFYDGLTSSVDSAANAYMTDGLYAAVGDMFSGTKVAQVLSNITGALEKSGFGRFAVKAGKDLAYALPMGLSAGAATYREVIEKYGPRYEEQAVKMAVATVFAETGSEAITVGNIHEAFSSGEAMEGAASLLKEFFKNGGEEALGEGANEWVSQQAERLIMGSKSEYEQSFKKFTSQGYPEEVARAMADKEAWKSIIRSAATGFISSAFGTGREYAAGRMSGNSTEETVSPVEESAPVAQDLTEETVSHAPMITEEAVSQDLTEESVEDDEDIVDEGLIQQDQEAIARMDAEEEHQQQIADQFKKDTAILSGISSGTNTTSVAVGLTTVLGTGTGAKAAGKGLISIAGNDGGLAARALNEILMATPGDTTGVKAAVSQASLVSGPANEQLKAIVATVGSGGTVTAQDVSSLVSAIQQQQAADPDGFSKALFSAIKESRTADRVVEILSTGEAGEAIQSAQDSVDQAKENLSTAQDVLEQAEAEVQTAREALAAAVSEQLNGDTADPSLNAPVEQAAEQVDAAQNNVLQQQQAVEAAQRNVDKAEQKKSQVEDKKLAEVRDQAVSEVDQQMAQEAEAAAQTAQQQAEQAFQDALSHYPPTKAFSKPVTVEKINGNPIQLTGVFGFTGPAGGDKTVYTTPYGYITDDYIGEYGDDFTDEFDAATDKWKNSDTSVHPAVWLDHSLLAMDNSTGEIVSIIGFAGQKDGFDPVMMDSTGHIYSSDEIKMEPDPFTGDNGNQALFDAFNGLNIDSLPDMSDTESETDQDITDEDWEHLTGQDQMPAGAVMSQEGPMTGWMDVNGVTDNISVIGMIPGASIAQSQYILEDGSIVNATNVSEGADLFDWAFDQVSAANPTGTDLNNLPSSTGEATTDEPGWGKIGNLSYLASPATMDIVDITGDTLPIVGMTVNFGGDIRFVDDQGYMWGLDELAPSPEQAQWMLDNIDRLGEDNFDHGISMVADASTINNFKNAIQVWLPGTTNQTPASSTQAPVSDEYSEGKINPKTGELLKNWQDPKYHGKVEKTTKKLKPTSKAFQKFFEKNAPEALPYVTNSDGTPRIFYRGFGAYGKALYTVHQSKSMNGPNGQKMYLNFYMDQKSTAASYAGTNKIIGLRYSKNWETAKAAMQDIGYDLVEAPNPNGSGQMGYQVTRYGSPAHTEGPNHASTWFAENELNRFNATYGGELKSQGIHAGYVALSKPLIIDGHGSNYSTVYSGPDGVTAPDGATYTGTQKTRLWAEWAFQHGYDSVIFLNVRDNVYGGGDVGTEIVTSQSAQFKSVYNKGSFNSNNPNILEKKTDTQKSPQLAAVQEKLELGKPLEELSLEERKALVAEIMNTPEAQAAFANKSDKEDTLPWDKSNAIRKFDGTPESIEAMRTVGIPETTITMLQNGASEVKAIESLFTPEDVEEQHRVRSKMWEQGSAVFDKDGKVSYTGEVVQGKRLDMLYGLPAAGKSTLANALSAQYHSRIGDPDDAKKFHRDYANGANSSPLHNESRFITDQVLVAAIANGDNVVLPVVGHSYSSVKRQIDAFKKAGYEIHVHDVQLPWGKAASRTLNRMVEDGRALSMDYIMGTDEVELTPQKINDTFDRLNREGVTDGYAVWDNDVEYGRPPVAVGYSDAGEVNITAGAFGRGADHSSGTLGGNRKGNTSGTIKALKIGPQAHDTPTAKQAQKVKAKLESPQRIAMNLVDKLKFGNYLGTNNFGNMPASVRGYWETHADYLAVRNKEMGNYVVTMHETGHGIADKLGLRGTQQMVDNLIKLEPEFATAYSADQLADEAFAEFFWRYMENEQRARNFAGDAFYDSFEQQLLANPEMYQSVQEARSQLQQWAGADVIDKLDSVIVYERSGEKAPLKERIEKFFQDTVSLLADKSAVAEQINQTLRDDFGVKDIGVQDNVRSMSLLGNHSQKQTSVMLTDFLIDHNGTIIGDGFGKMLASVEYTDANGNKQKGFKGTDENVKLLEKYALALHSINRDAEGKPVFDGHITQQERLDFIHEIEQTRPDIVAAEAVWQQFRHDFLQAWMVDTGYWTQDFLDQLEKTYPHYVPTFRVGGSIESMRGAGTGKQYTLHAATGSTQDVYSPLYSFIGMVDSITGMVNQNRVAQTFDRLYNQYEGLGTFARRIPGPANMNLTAIEQQELQDLLEGKIEDDLMEQVLDIVGRNPQIKRQQGGNILQVHREDGTVVAYQFHDPQLYKLLAGVEERSSIKAFDVLGKMTRTMSMLTTGSNPLFAARNAVRDFQNGVNYGSWASNYGTGAVKWARSFWEVAKGSADYDSYKALGGGGWTYISQGSSKSMNEMKTEIFGEDRTSIGKTAKWAGKKLWDIITMDRLNEIIEQTTRFAEYKYGQHDRSTVEGRQEAFLAAQESTVDFSRSGNGEAAYILKKVVPFFNASMQGVYRTGRQFTESERGRVGQRFAKTVINTALSSALASGLILRFMDDDDKEEFVGMLSDGIKANHMILPNPLYLTDKNGGHKPFVRIPLAQDPLTYAVHGAVTNAMWSGSTDEAAITLAATADVILDNLNPIGSGTVFQPFMDVSHNRTWYGGNIVRSAQSDWTDPTGQYNEDTPDAFKWLGNLFNTSPEIVEYLATQYTGFLGSVGIPALTKDDNGNIGGFDAVMQSIVNKWTADPATSNGVTNDFYNMAADFDTIKAEATADRPQGLLRRNLTQDQVNAAYGEAAEMLKSSGLIGKTKKLITDTYKEIDKINANATLSDEEKYELTRKARIEMTKQVQAANAQLQGYRKKYITGETLVDQVFNRIAKRTTRGAYAYVPTTEEQMPQAFQDDLNSGTGYMSLVKEAYDTILDKNGNKSDSILPHPQQTFTVKGVKYSIPDEEWDEYLGIYRAAYEEYVEKKRPDWDRMTDDQKKAVFAGSSSAHSRGMEAIRKEYLKRNGK